MTAAAQAAEDIVYPYAPGAIDMDGLDDLVPGISMLRHVMPGPLKHVNCWILDGHGTLALIDGGPNRADARLRWEVVLAGRFGGRNVEAIVCTHHHSDHLGCVGWLSERHETPVQMSAKERAAAEFYIGHPADDLRSALRALWRAAGWPDELLDRAPENGWLQYRDNVAALPPQTVPLTAGERLVLGGSAWTVVVGSGHSPEHICLLDETRGVFIAGDQVLPRISPNISLRERDPEADPLGEWLASIERLKDLPGGLLVLPSHGDPFFGLHPRLLALRDGHLTRLERLRGCLTKPRRAIDCFGAMFARPITESSITLATGETMSHLRHLQLAHDVRREIIDGVWWFEAA